MGAHRPPKEAPAGTVVTVLVERDAIDHVFETFGDGLEPLPPIGGPSNHRRSKRRDGLPLSSYVDERQEVERLAPRVGGVLHHSELRTPVIELRVLLAHDPAKHRLRQLDSPRLEAIGEL